MAPDLTKNVMSLPKICRKILRNLWQASESFVAYVPVGVCSCSSSVIRERWMAMFCVHCVCESVDVAICISCSLLHLHAASRSSLLMHVCVSVSLPCENTVNWGSVSLFQPSGSPSNPRSSCWWCCSQSWPWCCPPWLYCCWWRRCPPCWPSFPSATTSAGIGTLRTAPCPVIEVTADEIALFPHSHIVSDVAVFEGQLEVRIGWSQ